eukprot:2775030-Rhodomonas_salina.3
MPENPAPATGTKSERQRSGVLLKQRIGRESAASPPRERLRALEATERRKQDMQSSGFVGLGLFCYRDTSRTCTEWKIQETFHCKISHVYNNTVPAADNFVLKHGGQLTFHTFVACEAVPLGAGTKNPFEVVTQHLKGDTSGSIFTLYWTYGPGTTTGLT